MIYDFSRLISKYSGDIEVVKTQEGQYVNGRFVPGETVIGRIRGAILPIKSEKIYQSGGTLTESDRQLYTKVSLSEVLTGTYSFSNGDMTEHDKRAGFSDLEGKMGGVLGEVYGSQIRPDRKIKIRYKKQEFKVEEDTDYSDYARVYSYILKRVDAFDKPT